MLHFDILVIDISGFTQALDERVKVLVSGTLEGADLRKFVGPLRVCLKRQYCRRDADKCYEISTSHVSP